MKSVILLVFIIFNALALKSQLQVNPSNSPFDLAQKIIGFSGFVKSASLNCSPGASGSFTNGDVIGNGIILTTGMADSAEGPNLRNNTSKNHGTSGDSDLDALAGSFPTQDACILEFEVVPFCNELTFTYSFASEEYMEYVGRAFNDVFGFFVTGPNPIGPNYNKLNIATIGGVSINVNSINDTVNSAYYLNNTTNNTEYDGMTISITKTIQVIPCQVYKIKLGVADGYDGIYDAAVFVKEYDSVCSPIPVYQVLSRNIKVNEGCQDTLSFERSITNTQDTLYLSYYGTAANGADIATLPNYLVFNPGDDIASLLVQPLMDGVYEGQENLYVVYRVGNCGLIDTVRIRVEDEIVVSAGPEFTICSGDSVELQGFCPTITGLTYSWTPGFGLSDSTILTPKASIVSTDTIIQDYTYRLTAYYKGCTYYDTTTIHVVPNPTVAFDYYSNCDYDSVIFISGSSSPLPITNFWDYGDGYSGIGDTVYHKYTLNSYLVTLTSIDTLGCRDSMQRTITINPSPVANFSFTSQCEGEEICFNNLSTIRSGTIVSYNWDIDTLQTNAVSPCHTFNNFGIFNVSLAIESNLGCTDSISKPLRVYGRPTANFNANDNCEGDTVNFNNYSTTAGGVLRRSYWDFNNGSTDSVKNPKHLFGDGSYNIELIVEDQYGCRDTITKPLTIHPKPVADFETTTDTLCELACVDFINLSQHNTDSMTYYQWKFGDQFFLNQENASHCYTDSGMYTVSLIVMNNKGCMDSIKKKDKIQVFANPHAYFLTNKIHLDDYSEDLTVIDSSYFNITKYIWDFGDGTVDSSTVDISPLTHQYAETGNYLVTLTVFNDFGCFDDFYRVVYYRKDREIIYVPNAFTPDNDGKNDYFGVDGEYLDELVNFRFSIFDRWGNLVFETYDYREQWDGTHKGVPAKQDTYVWQLRYTNSNEDTKVEYGTATLLK